MLAGDSFLGTFISNGFKAFAAIGAVGDNKPVSVSLGSWKQRTYIVTFSKDEELCKLMSSGEFKEEKEDLRDLLCKRVFCEL